MSFDLFIMKLPDDPTPFDKQKVIDIFSRGALYSAAQGTVEYPDGGGRGEISGIEDEVVDHMMVSHFGGLTFISRLYEIADTFDAFLSWPADPEEEPNACVTKASLLPRCEPFLADGFNIAVAKDFIHLIEIYKGDPPPRIAE